MSNQRHKIWAFYVKTGSIERRQVIIPSPKGVGKVRASTESEVRASFPFDEWYAPGMILKVVPKVKEKKREICPENPHHHHLLVGECPFCHGTGGVAPIK